MNLKQFASTKKGQLILCLSFLALVWLVLLINFAGGYIKDIPDEKKIANASKELEKARSEFEKLNSEKRKNQDIEKRYTKMAAEAWLPQIDGAVETSLRRTGAGYFDFYLLHNLGDNRTQVFDDFGICNVIESKNVIAIILASEKHLAFICRQQPFIQTLLKLKGLICPLQFREHFLPGRTAKEVIVQQAYLFPCRI